MGQKVNPTSLRVGINKYWQSTWYEKKDYSNFLKEVKVIFDDVILSEEGKKIQV
jgi:hypothetical protein